MKNPNNAERDPKSGLFRGSDPLEDVSHRNLSTKDDDDATDADVGDADGTDGDKVDSDTVDEGDSRDLDGKD